MPQPLIIQYTNLLHKHGGPTAKACRDFIENHTDLAFRCRAQTLNKLFPEDYEQRRRRVLDTPLP